MKGFVLLVTTGTLDNTQISSVLIGQVATESQPLYNMRMLKVKTHPTVAFFDAVNHCRGSFRK